MSMDDLELARRLQEQFDQEANAEMAPFLPMEYRSPQKLPPSQKLSVVSDEWETIDPTPDLHALFLEFNQQFFWGRLVSCEVRWSPRMTQCAGICRYSPRERFCTIGISIPLLKLRPRKDLVETLLHEMIHAYLFVTDNNKDHDGHGPEFHKHMYRINQATGASISVYHTFHDEVALYKQHWWRCSGPCTRRPPFYGFVKRSMNRAPGPNDRWWGEHSNACGGSFTKVKEPEGFGQKKQLGKKAQPTQPGGHKPGRGQPDIRSLLGGGQPLAGGKTSTKNASSSGKTAPPSGASAPSGSTRIPPPPRNGGNIFGFGGTSYSSPGGGGGGLRTAGKVGTVVVKPGTRQPRDNSSPGTVVGSGGAGPVDTGSGIPENRSVVSGTRLGGSSGNSSSSILPEVTAREAVRLRWTSSFPSPATSTAITNSSATSERSVSILEQDSERSSGSQLPVPPEDEAACPVCDRTMAMAAINDHLDRCLLQAQNGGGDSGHAARDSSSRSSGEKASRQQVDVISDSDEEEDDDEPLAKRRPDFDLSTEQDDRDLLAALEEDWNPEEEEDGEGAAFTCPICLNMLPHRDMAGHLERCLP